MGKVRFRYSKTGRAMYISHLDLTATMRRSFLRAGINLKYSEGFNPHPYMSVALPLSVGCESICELIDVAIADDIVPDLRSIKLPDGLEISEAYIPASTFNDISWIEINGKMHYDKKTDNDIIKRLKQCFSQKSIIITKRTKRGSKELDIAPHIKDLDFSFVDNEIMLTAKLSAQDPSINADDLLNALDNELKPAYTFMKRIAIYDTNMIIFR